MPRIRFLVEMTIEVVNFEALNEWLGEVTNRFEVARTAG